MPMGYYYDDKTKKFDYGEHPAAKPTIEQAMEPEINMGTSSPMVPMEIQPEVEKKVAPPNNTASPVTKGVQGAAPQIAQGSGPEDIAAQGLVASGNPYAMGAGLGLMTLSSINKQKNLNAQNRYLAEVKKQTERQEAINRLAQIGQNLKA